MALSDLASVVISTTGPALTQVGFGTLLCAAYHTVDTGENYTRTYESATAAATDGFDTASAAYIMLARAFSQSPSPATVKLGRLATPATQVVKFGLQGAAQASKVYGFTMLKRTSSGVLTSVDITFTSDGTPLASEIVTGLAAAVEASSLAAAVAAVTADTNTTCQITNGTPGDIIYYSNWTNNLTFSDVTTDPGIAADLVNIRTRDGDWYGLAIDQNNKAMISAASGWAETELCLFGANTSESAAFDAASTTDTGYVLKGLSRARTILGFDLDNSGGYMGVAMLAERFPHDVGQAGAGGTFHGKTLSGVSADALTATQKTNLRAKNYVVYITTGGRNHTLDGKVIGGEFADKIRGLDWFKTRTEERIAQAILDNDKIPFTDAGITILLSQVLAQGQQAEDVNFFTPGSFTATAPKNSAVSSSDRNTRNLSGIKFQGQVAGAIHFVKPITGNVT
jgi:hypothetical protein